MMQGVKEIEDIVSEDHFPEGNENFNKQLFCTLGHYNLLLARFPQGMHILLFWLFV